MTSSDFMVGCQEIFLKYGGTEALRGVEISLETGEVAGVIGPNGSGKTSLIDVLTGFRRPDHGKVLIRDFEVTSWPPWDIAKRGVIRVFQELRLFGRLSVRENLDLAARRRGEENPFRAFFGLRQAGYEPESADSADLLGAVGVDVKSSKPVRELSYGQQKVLSICMALRTDGRILLLDEPVSGLAPDMRETIGRFVVRKSKAGRGILIVEHDIDFVAQYCSKTYLMEAGRITRRFDRSDFSKASIVDAFVG